MTKVNYIYYQHIIKNIIDNAVIIHTDAEAISSL